MHAIKHNPCVGTINKTLAGPEHYGLRIETFYFIAEKSRLGPEEFNHAIIKALANNVRAWQPILFSLQKTAKCNLDIRDGIDGKSLYRWT